MSIGTFAPHTAPPRARRWSSALSAAIRHEVGGQNRAAIRRPLIALRRLGVRAGDPAVTFTLDGTDLHVPLSHDLPLIRAQHPGYSANLGDIASVVARARPDGTMVDIGANVGDSVAIVRARTSLPILCVEGDETFLPYLRHNVAHLSGVQIEPVYVADSDGPIAHAVVERAGGTARLIERADAPAVATDPLAEILDRQRPPVAPVLIKIDTDGHDAAILAAAHDVLAAHRPVLFFEHDPAMAAGVGAGDANAIFTTLIELGYATFALYANTGEPVAVHRAAELSAILARCDTLTSGSGDGNAYFDIVAVHALDDDIASAVRSLF